MNDTNTEVKCWDEGCYSIVPHYHPKPEQTTQATLDLASIRARAKAATRSDGCVEHPCVADVPRLCDEIERLRAENAELKLVKDACAERIFEQAREIGNLQRGGER